MMQLNFFYSEINKIDDSHRYSYRFQVKWVVILVLNHRFLNETVFVEPKLKLANNVCCVIAGKFLSSLAYINAWVKL